MPRLAFRTALVTGASAGLGASFARALAAAGTGLILVARRRERLEELARDLRARHGVAVDVLAADLASDEGLAAVESAIAASGSLDLLVNDAGFGGRHGFIKTDLAGHLRMVRVHVEAPVRLTKAAMPGMIGRGRGAVINLSSVAGFSPFSGAMYSGTKSFLAMFSVNLQSEVRSSGIVVQALCPGMTHTELHEVAGIDKRVIPAPFWMTADQVVRVSLRRLGRGVICVPGWYNKALVFLMRCPTTAVLVRAVGRGFTLRRFIGRDE